MGFLPVILMGAYRCSPKTGGKSIPKKNPEVNPGKKNPQVIPDFFSQKQVKSGIQIYIYPTQTTSRGGVRKKVGIYKIVLYCQKQKQHRNIELLFLQISIIFVSDDIYFLDSAEMSKCPLYTTPPRRPRAPWWESFFFEKTFENDNKNMLTRFH